MEKIEKIKQFLSGNGDGDGDGNGNGDGNGYDIKLLKYKGYDVFYVDKIPTVFDRIMGDIAKVKTINDDFSTKECFIARGYGYFAHGATVRDAQSALEEKITENMPVSERIALFNEKFNRTDKYKGIEFFDWHNRLTRSCLEGRKQFIANKGLDLEREYTVNEFISICENAFGGEVIRQLKEKTA